MVAVQEHAVACGKTILLETQRVDPRDLLRDDEPMNRAPMNRAPCLMADIVLY